MQAPLTSLDPICWLVWADYCQEAGRAKAEAFARKTAHALKKLLANGSDPGLVLGVKSINQWGEIGWGLVVKRSQVEGVVRDARNGGTVTYDGLPFKSMTTDFRWLTLRHFKRVRRHENVETVTPADLWPHWKGERIYWKFFRMLQRRATGIPDGVLEVTDATGGGV